LNPITLGKIALSDYYGTGVAGTIPSYFFIFLKVFTFFTLLYIIEKIKNKLVNALTININYINILN